MADPKKPDPPKPADAAKSAGDPPGTPGRPATQEHTAEPDPAYPDRSAIPSHGAEQPKTAGPWASAAEPTAPGGEPVEASAPVEWAADLIRELGATGTGADKLDKIRRAMVERFNDPRHAEKGEDHPDRHLSAREAVDLLDKDPAVGELTKVKARALAETGTYTPAVGATPHDADRLPAPPKGKAGSTPERAAAQRTIATGKLPFDAAGNLPAAPPKPDDHTPGAKDAPRPGDKPKGK